LVERVWDLQRNGFGHKINFALLLEFYTLIWVSALNEFVWLGKSDSCAPRVRLSSAKPSKAAIALQTWRRYPK
jgi:hypothetical protein